MKTKRLILICGPNGVGKSSTSKELVKQLDKSAYIESEWCRIINPFAFNDETIKIIQSNISSMMINYFQCSFIENVIFPYGFHGPRKQIFEGIINILKENDIAYQFCPIVLTCDKEENIKRMQNDNRDEDRIQRALVNTRNIYNTYTYPKIDSTELSIEETIHKINDILTIIYPLS